MNDGPPPSRARADGLARRAPHLGHVVAVHLDGRHAERPRPVRDPPATSPRPPGVNSENPLFSQTKTTGSRQSAEMFRVSMSTPWFEAPSPKKHDRRLAVRVELGAESRAGRDRQPRAHDPVGAENPLGEVGDVHRAAHALADPLALGPDLGHHRPHVAALGEEVAVAAVGARWRSRGPRGARTPRRRPPPRRCTGARPRQLARGAVVPQALLDAPDQHHGLVQPERFRRRRPSRADDCLRAPHRALSSSSRILRSPAVFLDKASIAPDSRSDDRSVPQL